MSGVGARQALEDGLATAIAQYENAEKKLQAYSKLFYAGDMNEVDKAYRESLAVACATAETSVETARCTLRTAGQAHDERKKQLGALENAVRHATATEDTSSRSSREPR